MSLLKNLQGGLLDHACNCCSVNYVTCNTHIIESEILSENRCLVDEIRKSMDNFITDDIMIYKQLLHLPVLFVYFTVYTGTITDCPLHP